jgi:uncharacterized protein
MPQGNVDVLQSAYDAFGRGDIPAVMSVFGDDIDWHAPAVLPQGMDARGQGEVGQFFQRLGSVWEDLKVEVDDFVASGDKVAVVGRASGKLGGSETGYGFVHLWTMENGKAVRFQEYADPPPEVARHGG